MQINNNPRINQSYNQTNFTGIYRLPYRPNVTKEVQEKVIPMYQHLRHRPVMLFEGRNPFIQFLDQVKGFAAEANNSSKAWVDMNAKRHGVSVPSTEIDCIHVFSGDDDLLGLMETLNKRLELYDNSFSAKLKRFFSRDKRQQPEEVAVPSHLWQLGEGLKIYNAEAGAYDSYIAGKTVVDVSTPQELLMKMLQEK